MKTSPKSSVALLAVLALGGSTAGVLFAESLQTEVNPPIGTAGAYFPDMEISKSVQQAVSVADETESHIDEIVIALPIEANTAALAPVPETQVRAITTTEVDVQTTTPTPNPAPSTSEIPAATTQPEPESSPEASASQTPEPEFELPESEADSE